MIFTYLNCKNATTGVLLTNILNYSSIMVMKIIERRSGAI